MSDFIRRQLDLARQIRYVKLFFQVKFIDGGALPYYKSSALRGGMGDMLMDLFCLRDKVCETCDFEDFCVMRRIMYPPYDIVPSFTSGRDRIGYLITCDDYREEVQPEDTLCFSVTLFGKTIADVRQVVQAFEMFGEDGLGEERVRFRLVRVTNAGGALLEEGGYFNREALKILQVGEYVDGRMKVHPGKRLVLQTPTDIHFRGESLKHFELEPLMRALARRIYMYTCFEGIECEEIKLTEDQLPKLESEYSKRGRVKRYSSRTQAGMSFEGIFGYAELEDIPEYCTEMILMGELFQVGKNTKFGLGKIMLT